MYKALRSVRPPRSLTSKDRTKTCALRGQQPNKQAKTDGLANAKSSMLQGKQIYACMKKKGQRERLPGSAVQYLIIGIRNKAK